MAEKQIIAKFAGRCKACGNSISAGDQIFWEQGKGARHIKCEEVKRLVESNMTDGSVKREEPKVFALPAIPEALDTIIKAYFNEGEYCSGWSVSTATQSLEILGLGHYLSGWGWIFDNNAKKALGESFTLAQAMTYAEPILRAKHDAAEVKRLAGDNKRAEAFSEARRTGKEVVLKRWSEDCNDSREECNVDNLTMVAMPDGTTKTTRNHTW